MSKGSSHQTDQNNPFLDNNFSELFDRLYTPLCRYCMKYVGDPGIAEDLVQEQFVYIWENRSRLREIDSIKSYLYTAVRHRSISYLRSQYVRKTALCLDDLAEGNLHNSPLDPEKLAESKELEQILEEALDALPKKCRAIFSLKKFDELSNKEIAGKLKISVKTVESQMTIAFRKINVFIASRWGLLLIIMMSILKPDK